MSPEDRRHGTRAGYTAHRRAQQEACAPCRRAEAAYQASRPPRNRPPRSHTRRQCAQCVAVFEVSGNGQLYCSKPCRQAARNKRRRDAAPNPVPEIVLHGTAYRFGAYAPKQKAVRCRVPVGVMAYCPNCDAVMGGISPHHRVCRFCATEVLFNPEEVEAASAGLITA